MAACTECGATKPSAEETCPVCNPASGAISLGGIGIMEYTKAEMIYGDHRSWTELWAALTRAHRIFQEDYRGLRNGAGLKADIWVFYILCWHLKDWLQADQEVKAKVSDVESALRITKTMQLCEAMANTTKHHTRYNPSHPVAVVSSVMVENSSPGSARSKAIITSAGQHHDSLRLANDCMEWWRAYLASRLISIPA